MAHSKKTLQSYIMTLQCFRDAIVKAKEMNRRSVYEVSALVRNTRSNVLEKKFFFVLGLAILPDDPCIAESLLVHKLTPNEIKQYEEKCRKYGI